MKKLSKILFAFILLLGLIVPVFADDLDDPYFSEIVDNGNEKIQSLVENGEEVEGEESENYGIISLDFSPIKENMGDGGSPLVKAGPPPASYDSRNVGGVNYVSSVKNQGSFGTCWAFTAMAASESSMIRRGITNSAIDLSELQVAYFAYNNRPLDPLGNTSGTSTKIAGNPPNDYLNCGGTLVTALMTMANYVGARTEAGFNSASGTSYSTLESLYRSGGIRNVLNKTKISSALGHTGDYRLANAYFYDCSDLDATKNAIMDHGALHTNMYWTDGNYNSTTAAYYQKATKSTNHAVTLVGWNDNYNKSNFRSGKQPNNNGAWLVKNSWGTNWGNAGYFWLSYEDTSYLYGVSVAYQLSTTKYNNVYQYDAGMLNVSWLDNSNKLKTQSMANIYKASAFATERIKAVSFYTQNDRLDYTVRIYRDIPVGGSPTSGALVSTTNGSLYNSGYHTVNLVSQVDVGMGQRYSVVVELRHSSITPVMVVDKSYTINPISYTAKPSIGRSYYYRQEAGGWSDFGNMGSTARIKVFTDNVVVAVTGVTLNRASLSLAIGEEDTLVATVYPSNANNKKVTWTSSNPAVAKVDGNGKVTSVTASATPVTITVRTLDGNFSASCSVTSFKRAVTSISMVGSADVFRGYTITLVPTVNPSNATNKKVNWSSANPAIATVDSNGVVKGISNGTTTITARADDNNAIFANCSVRVEEPVFATGFTINTTSMNLTSLRKQQLIATRQPVKSIGTITFKSSDTSVAVVDADGWVLGLKAGTATITATMGKIKLTCNVSVNGETPILNSVTSVNFNSMAVNFSPRTSTGKYEVHFSTNKSTGFKRLATVDTTMTTTYYHNSAQTGTRYYYKVRGVVTFNGKTYGGPFSATLSGVTGLKAPWDVAAIAGTSSVTVYTNKVDGAHGYQYRYATTYSGSYKLAKTTTATKFKINKLSGGRNYYFKVRAYRQVGGKKIYGPYSSVTTCYVDNALPKVKVSNMRVGNGSRSLAVKAYYKYTNVKWVQFTVNNKGVFSLKLINKVGQGYSYPVFSNNWYLASSNGAKKSSISIGSGKSKIIRLRLKSGYSTTVYWDDSFFVKSRYDNVDYVCDFWFKTAWIWYSSSTNPYVSLTGVTKPDNREVSEPIQGESSDEIKVSR